MKFYYFALGQGAARCAVIEKDPRFLPCLNQLKDASGNRQVPYPVPICESFGSGFNGVSGSGSRETESVPQKKREKLRFFMVESSL
jgi:hypothetical protein